MSGNGANLIFFNNKKKRIGRPEYSLTPPPPSPHPFSSDNISFLSYPPFKVNVTCLLPLTAKMKPSLLL